MLKKRIPNSPHKIDYKDLESRDDMSYIEKPVKILHRKKKTVLRTKTHPDGKSLVKKSWTQRSYLGIGI